MIDCLLLAILCLVAYGIGRICLRPFFKDSLSEAEEFLFSVSLGLGLLAYSVYILGLFKALYPGYAIILLLLYGAVSIRRISSLIGSSAARLKKIRPGRFSFFEKSLMLILFLAVLFSLFGALAPATGNDALAYHLYHPKIFIQRHCVEYIPHTRSSLWPYLTEMLFTLGMLLRNEVLAKLFHYCFGLLNILALYLFAKRFALKKTALLAAVLFYLAPGIFMQATYAYVDLSFSFYSFMALYCLLVFYENKERGYLILSGIFLGLSLSVKYLGLVTLLAALGVFLYQPILSRRLDREIIYNLIIFLVFAFLFSFGWYLRSFIILKNPVYPFGYNIFKTGWPNLIGEDMGYIKSWYGFFRLPWDLVMHQESFGGEQIGIIALAFLILWYVFESICIRPDYLAYFNQFAGGPDRGWRYLRDANIDYGQDLPALAEYMKKQGIGKVKLSYFGTADPAYYGISYASLDDNDITRPQKDVYAISVNYIDGISWVNDIKPTAKAGYSIFIYDFRAENGS